jgi:hypothetical protein
MIYLDSQHKLSRLFGVLSAPLEELSGANPHQDYARKLCSQTRGVLLTSLHRLRYLMAFVSGNRGENRAMERHDAARYAQGRLVPVALRAPGPG